MPCFHPLQGFRSRHVGASGKRAIVFNPSDGYVDMPVTVACGQCVGCRLERSRQWAIRCVHEASLHRYNSFLTLTYADEHLPLGGSLEFRDFQLFMKRLRKAGGAGIRFFHCGEYGDLLKRPHYHAIIFNYDFADKVLWKEERGNRTFVSPLLQELWPFGFSMIGEVTFQSAAYVARYVMKKITGPGAVEYYRREDGEGNAYWLAPEYTTMSRRPGVGQGWFDKFRGEVYPLDRVVIRGRELRPPRYYDGQYEILDPVAYRSLKARRVRDAKVRAAARPEENQPSRLRAREKVAFAKLGRLKRSFEGE